MWPRFYVVHVAVFDRCEKIDSDRFLQITVFLHCGCISARLDVAIAVKLGREVGNICVYDRMYLELLFFISVTCKFSSHSYDHSCDHTCGHKETRVIGRISRSLL